MGWEIRPRSNSANIKKYVMQNKTLTENMIWVPATVDLSIYRKWCKDNLIGGWTWVCFDEDQNNEAYAFTEYRDMVYFKIKWG
jgi:hypothetical protein